MSGTPLGLSDLKWSLRKKISQIKISKLVRQSRSKKLSLKIQRSDFFKNSKTIGFYSALPDEVDVFFAVKAAIDLKKRVYFPRLTRNKIEFFEVKDLKKELRIGKFGVLEPLAIKANKRIKPLDLIFVPGRAFDKKGGRLGRGGGHYDQLLEKWDSSIRVGVAFREQMVKKVPSEAHDVFMDVVISA